MKTTALLTQMVITAAAMTLVTSGCGAQSSNVVQGVKPDQPAYPIGTQVLFTFGVENRGDKPVTYTFSSSKQFDLWIKRGPKEIYRLSKGKMYASVITHLQLEPKETKTFSVKWDQKDNDRKDVGPGTYTVHAQLTPSRVTMPVVFSKLQIGRTAAAIPPVTVKEAINRFNDLKDRTVSISAAYKGWRPDPEDPNTKDGPPITRSDWTVCDSTGCMYVHGSVNLDPLKDVGKKVTVTGKLKKTDKGQVYLVLASATVEVSEQ